MNLIMRKLVFHVLMAALSVPAFIAYGALPEVHLDSLTKGASQSGSGGAGGSGIVIIRYELTPKAW